MGVAALVIWLLWYFADLVFYILVGFIIAYLLGPVVDFLQGVGFRRIPSILLTFVLLLGGLFVLLASLVPFVVEQVMELSDLISLAQVNQLAIEIEEWLRRFLPQLEPGVIRRSFEEMFRALFQTDAVANTVFSVTTIFANIFYAVIVIPFVAFFFLKDRRLIRESLLHLIPNRYFEISLGIIDKVEYNLGRYFRALLIQSVSVAVVAAFFLSMVGLENATGVGIVAGIANTIPYFGPLMGLIAGLLVGIAQTGDLSLVFGVVVAIALTQASDMLLFQPYIFSRASRLHPLIILLAVLIGAKVGGIVGMLLAIPVTTVSRVMISQIIWSFRRYTVFQG
jgi:predicted PurR-regulated permease PerM